MEGFCLTEVCHQFWHYKVPVGDVPWIHLKPEASAEWTGSPADVPPRGQLSGATSFWHSACILLSNPSPQNTRHTNISLIFSFASGHLSWSHTLQLGSSHCHGGRSCQQFTADGNRCSGLQRAPQLWDCGKQNQKQVLVPSFAEYLIGNLGYSFNFTCLSRGQWENRDKFISLQRFQEKCLFQQLQFTARLDVRRCQFKRQLHLLISGWC